MQKQKYIKLFAENFGKELIKKDIFPEEEAEAIISHLNTLGFVFVQKNGKIKALRTPPLICPELLTKALSKAKFQFKPYFFDEIDSTNTFLKGRAESGEQSFAFAVSETQSAGRGRLDREFSSPKGDGLYLSLLLRPQTDIPNEKPQSAVTLTASAAVAAYEAIKKTCGIKTDIKWVNDLYFNGKKICGILAEGAFDPTKSNFEYVVLGIGINICTDFSDTNLKNIASSLFTRDENLNFTLLKSRLAAEFLLRFTELYQKSLSSPSLFKKYEKNMFLNGKTVTVISSETEKKAIVLGLKPDFSLEVQYESGERASLVSGEVRVALK